MTGERADHTDLQDVGVTPVTPFSNDLGSIDLAGLRANLRHLMDAGVRLVYPCGNTGEAASLTLDEWTAVVETTVEECGDRAFVLPGIGQEYPTAMEAARRAASIGAHGLLLMPRDQAYVDSEGLARYWRSIGEVAGLPVVVYKRALPDDGTLRRVIEETGAIGCKYSGRDIAAFASLATSQRSGFAWTCGLAERYASLYWPAGVRGFTSGLANVVPGLPLALLGSLRAGDASWVSAARADAARFEDIRARHRDAYNVAAVKTAMDVLGLAGGSVRPPLRPVDAATTEQIRTLTMELAERWGTP